MLVSHALLIDPDPLNSQDLFFLREEPCVHLVIGHDKQEDDADEGGEQPDDQKQQLP